MLLRLRRWYRECSRAEKLGWSFRDNLSGGRVFYWEDPETGKIWMATKRYPLTGRVPANSDRENVIRSLEHLPWAECYAEECQ